LHGSGVFVIRVHIPTGRVTDVGVALSTGNQWLDRSAVAALRTWRFKPGATPYHKASVKVSPPQGKDDTFIKIPVTFL
jgi:TonB family protein